MRLVLKIHGAYAATRRLIWRSFSVRAGESGVDAISSYNLSNAGRRNRESIAPLAGRFGQIGDAERLATGQLAPAVAIAILVAEDVEQRIGLRRVVPAKHVPEIGVVSGNLRRERRLRGKRLTVSNDVHFLHL